MKILVVSGFLGAGKTTFIKELIRRSGKYLVVLENEYGQNNLDSQELQGGNSTDLKLLEFMEGCVCCTQKDKFSNTIVAISAGIDPDYLVVEPTGVGKLSNILNAVRKVAYEKICLLKPIVILTPHSFDYNLQMFGDIFRDQIINAGRIIFSKNETADPALLGEVCEKIFALNSSAEIIQSHYSAMSQEWWDSLLLEEGEQHEESQGDGAEKHDDETDQVTLRSCFCTRPAELILLLEDILRGEFGLIPRAKGVIQVGGEWLRFSLADQLYAIIQEPEEANQVTQCVFIGRYLNKAKLAERLKAYDSLYPKTYLNKAKTLSVRSAKAVRKNSKSRHEA